MTSGRAHETGVEEAPDRRAARPEESSGLEAWSPERQARVSRATVAGLQRSAGSQAVSQLLAVQRHAEGEELPAVQEDAAEIAQKQAASHAAGPEAPAEIGPAGPEAPTGASAPPTPTEEQPQPTETNQAPPATRTAEEEKTQKESATKAGGDFEKAPALTRGAMSLASAQAVLQGEYGAIKTFVQGTIQILADQPAISAKYDEVCIADHIKRPDGSDWKAGDRAKDDAAAGVTIEGFAWKGVVYVNGKTTLVTATAHEMLHVNTHADFRGKVGETINEGSTEYFARKALTNAGITVPGTTAYPTQVKIVTDLVALVGEDCLQKAYFSDPNTLVTSYEAKGSNTFAELKTAAEALDLAKVADALKPKAAAPAPAPVTPPAPAAPPAPATPPTGS